MKSIFFSFIGVGQVLGWFNICTQGMKIHVTAADGYVFGKSRTRGFKAWITAEQVKNHG